MRKTQTRFFVVFCTGLLVLSTLIVGVGAFRTSEGAEKNIVQVRISEEKDLSELDRFDIDTLEMYENSLLIEADQETIEEIEDTGMEVNRLPNRTQIAVKGHTFDIDDGPDLDPDLMVDSYEEGTEGLYVVHMLGPVHPEWRFTLEEEDVNIVNYVPNHAYEVSMTPETAEDVKELDFVDWVGIYHPEFKLHSRLDEALEEDMSVNLRLRPGFESSSPLELESEFEVHSFEDLREDGYRLVVDVDSMEQLEDVARMNDVYFISPHVEPELHGEMDSQLIGGGAWFMDDEYDKRDDLDPPPREGDPQEPYRKHGDYGAYINQLGYSGEGVTVAIADTGIGDGTVGDAGVDDFTGRVIGGYSFGSDEDEWQDGHYHGTACAGLVAGDTHRGTGTTWDEQEEGDMEYYMGQGLAYEAELFATKMFDDDGGSYDPPYYEIVEEPAQRSDAYIHSNSWGMGTDGEYFEVDEIYDQAVRDADRDDGENVPMVITSSAGNQGGRGDYEQEISSPGNAKNVITIGGNQPYNPGLEHENPENMYGSSSRGWTEDNRVKPDVLAPSESVISQNTPLEEGGYVAASGTSFGNPLVAGAASIIVEWYEENYEETPSPAMVRSILINTATELDPEVGDTRGHIPNRDEGWGVPDLSKLEYPKEQPVGFRNEDQETLLTTDEVEEYTVGLADTSEPLKITLSWTDKNAMEGDSQGGTPTLKNNLDLEVETPGGEVIRGNAFDLSGDGESDDGFTHPDAEVMSDFDYSGDGWDDRNNVQNVYIHPDDVEAGAYDIRVIGTEVPADSNNDGISNQDFALTAYNADPPSDGVIAMDEEGYATEDTVELTVIDGDLFDEVEVDVGIHSDTDPTGFNVTLYGGEERYDFAGKVDISETGGPETLEVSHEDTITAEYWDEDTGDGTGAMKEVTAYVDGVPPVLDMRYPEEGSYINESKVMIEWDGYDETSGIEYYEIRANDGDWITVGLDTSFVLDDLDHAENYTVEVNATNGVGLETINSTTFTVDRAPPQIEIVFPEDGGWGSIDMAAEWEGTDEVSGINNYEVRLDGGDWIDVGDVTEHEFTDLSVEEHTLEVRAWDRAGNQEVASTTFDIDPEPPYLEIVSPEEDSIFDTDRTSVRWESGDDHSGLSHIEVRLGEDEWIDVDLAPGYTFRDIEDGTHTATVRAIDNARQRSYDEVTFTVDTTPPQLLIVSPEQDAAYAEDEVTIEWKGDDRISGIDFYEVRIDQGEWIDVGPETSYTFEGLDEGTHEVEVRAWDNAENNNIKDIEFTVDMTPPEITLSSPEVDEFLPTDEVNVTWDSSDDVSGISHHEIRLNEDDWTKVGTSPFYTLKGVEDGDHTVEVRVIDEAGNSAQDEVSFTVDTTPPELKITSHDAGETVDSDEVTVTWTGSDEISGMESYEVRIDGGDWMDVGLDESYVFEDLEEGDHTVEVRATGRAGHHSVESVEFTVDTTPPEVDILTPEDGESFAVDEVTVTWSGTDEVSGIDTFKIRLDDGQWIEVDDATQYTFEELSDGRYTVEVMAQDEAGNTETKSLEFTVDTTPPELSITSHDAGETVDGDEVTVKWEGTDEVSGSIRYEVRLNHGIWIDVGSDTEYTFEHVSEGDNTVEIRAVDEAGNERMEQFSFTADEGIPGYWWMIIGVIVVVLGTVVFFVTKSKEKEVDREPETDPLNGEDFNIDETEEEGYTSQEEELEEAELAELEEKSDDVK